MISRKTRRESGRVYNKNYDPEKGEYYTIKWDDWNDHRDGFRNLKDLTKKKPKHLYKEHWCWHRDLLDKGYKKVKKLLLRQRFMREKERLKNGKTKDESDEEAASKKICKALKGDRTRCEREARLGGYCTIHYISHGYKENKTITKQKREKERIERLHKRQQERLEKSRGNYYDNP